MNLYTKIRSYNMVAMKEKDTIARGVLTLVINRIQKIEKKKGSVTDEDVISAIKTEQKQINETLSFARQNNRDETVVAEEQKLEILNQLLPKQLSEDEILDLLNSLGAQKGDNVGKLMGMVMKDHKSEVDGKTVNKVIRENFS